MHISKIMSGGAAAIVISFAAEAAHATVVIPAELCTERCFASSPILVETDAARFSADDLEDRQTQALWDILSFSDAAPFGLIDSVLETRPLLVDLPEIAPKAKR